MRDIVRSTNKYGYEIICCMKSTLLCTHDSLFTIISTPSLGGS